MESFEVVVNIYFMYEGEPFHFARWIENGERYIAAYIEGEVLPDYQCKSLNKVAKENGYKVWGAEQ